MGPFTAPFPQNGKWLHHSSTQHHYGCKNKLRKGAKGVWVGLSGELLLLSVSYVTHNLPGSCKTKCHYSSDTKEFLPPGSSCEEDWELSASGLPDRAVLVMVSQRG